MLDHLTNPLKFPKYSSVAHLEGHGNYAVEKYYKWPYRYFYRHKIRMIERMLRGRSYRNIIDFGCGPGLFTDQWHEYSEDVILVDKESSLDKLSVDLIICASVMEFVPLDETFNRLAMTLETGGDIIVASPMQNSLSRFYFNKIKDKIPRNSHQSIFSEMSSYFNIRHYTTWLGLYFCAMGKKR